MHLNGFFRISWVAQLLVGITLFAVSFLIESVVLQSFFALPVLALVLAIALELGKAAAIIWHRYLSHTAAPGYTLFTRIISAGFRVGLLGLSVLCSLLYLGLQLDRPNLESVRDRALATIEQREQAGLQGLETEHQARLAAAAARRQQEYLDLRNDHRGLVAELEAMLRAEMDNTIGGHFKGPRYREIEARLNTAMSTRDQALLALSSRHREEAREQTASLAEHYHQARADLRTAADRQRRDLDQSGLDADERTHHPRVVVFMRMARTLFDWQVSAPQFVFMFSLFLSLLMELGIVLAFDTVTLAVIPALAAQHREQVMNETLMAEVAGSATRDDIRHGRAMRRARDAADRLMERAHVHLRGARASYTEPDSSPRKAA